MNDEVLRNDSDESKKHEHQRIKLWTMPVASILLGGLAGVAVGCVDTFIRGNDSTPNYYVLVVVYGFMYGALAGLIAGVGGTLAALVSASIRSGLFPLAIVLVGVGAATSSVLGWLVLFEAISPIFSGQAAVPGIIMGTAATCIAYVLARWFAMRRTRAFDQP